MKQLGLALISITAFQPAFCAERAAVPVSTTTAKAAAPAPVKFVPAAIENLLLILRTNGAKKADMDAGVLRVLAGNGKTWEENPYLPELLPYIPEGALNDTEKLQLALYLWSAYNCEAAVPLVTSAKGTLPWANAVYGLWLYKGMCGLKTDQKAGKKLYDANKVQLQTMSIMGNRESIIALAMWRALALNDRNGNPDKEGALSVARPLLKANDPIALMLLASAGVAEKPSKSGLGIDAVARAAEAGLPPAQMMLGGAYLEGMDVVKDPRKAVEWLTKASKGRMMLANVILGKMYWDGNGVPQNYGESLKWYRNSADMRHPESLRILGYAYEKSLGEPRDLQRSIAFYKLSSRWGDGFSSNKLGMFYYQGSGVSQDYKEAYVMFSLAAEQGEKDALQNLKTLAGEMNAGQIKAAREDFARRKASPAR